MDFLLLYHFRKLKGVAIEILQYDFWNFGYQIFVRDRKIPRNGNFKNSLIPINCIDAFCLDLCTYFYVSAFLFQRMKKVLLFLVHLCIFLQVSPNSFSKVRPSQNIKKRILDSEFFFHILIIQYKPWFGNKYTMYPIAKLINKRQYSLRLLYEMYSTYH